MNRFAAACTTSLIALLFALPVMAAEPASKDVAPGSPATTAAPKTTDTSKPSVNEPSAPSAPATSVPAAPGTTAPSTAPTTPASSPNIQRARIGYVDLLRIAAESNEGKTASAQLKAKSEKLRAKIEARQKQIEKQKSAIEAKLESMSQKERAAKAKEFQKKVEEYQKLVRNSDEEMRELQDKYTESVYDSIKDVAVEYAVTNGYDAVLAKKEMLYLSSQADSRDLTDQIIAKLNQRKKTK